MMGRRRGPPAPGNRRLLVFGAAAIATSVVVARLGDLNHRTTLAVVTGGAWVIFAAGAWWVLRSPGPEGSERGRSALWVVVGIAATLQVPGQFAGQHISNDAYRYVWDGRVQLSGTSPYRYSPLDDHLARLRDPYLFPGLRPDQRSGVGTVKSLPSDKRQLAALARDDGRTRINRPAVPTIYPPMAQMWFAAVAAVTPWSWGTHGLQVAGSLLVVAFTLLLGRRLLASGGDPRRALLWGWCPTVVIEASIGAHVDVVAAVLVGSAVVVCTGSARRRQWVGGLLLGLAVAAKLTPALLLPAFAYRRRGGSGRRLDVRVPFAALATTAASYLPYLLATGTLVLGFLPGYFTEEGFDDGHGRYAVLGLILPPSVRRPAAVIAVILLAVAALWRTRAERPQEAAVWLFGGALLIGTPGYPWYALTLLALAVLAERYEWLAVAAAMYPVYALYRVPHLPGIAFGTALLVVLATTWVRRRDVRQPGASGSVDPRRVPRRTSLRPRINVDPGPQFRASSGYFTV